MDAQAIEQLPMPATYARHLTRLFDPHELFAGTGLRPADLDDPNLRITVQQAVGYVLNAIRLAAEGDWYLAWAGELSDHFHGPMSLALSSAPTLGDGVNAFVRYFPSRIPYMHMAIRHDDASTAVELSPLIELGEATPLLVETPLLILQRHLESVYGIDMQQAALELAHQPTPYADRYSRYFHCDISFASSRHALVLPRAWRGLNNLGYIESSWTHAVSQCEAMMGSSSERETLGAVRAELSRAFERKDRTRPLPTLKATAERLHVAPRTLIRRLRRLGTSYQELTDEFLRARALEMLENDDTSVKEIAAALGFENATNFGKAFRRWCGTSPGRYRNERIRRSAD